jgi:ribosomal biogenesis protein LAS1
MFFYIYVNLFLGRHHQASSDYRQEICQIEHLSFLFAWLVGSLKELKPRPHKDSAAEIRVSPTKTFLLDLLRKSLLVSAPANKQLLDSAIRLAQLIGNSSLMEKLKKLPLLGSSNSEEEIEIPSTTNFFVQHEESISQAAKKLELVKLRRLKSKVVETSAGDAENSNRWVLSRSWNPCPIGMLPHTLGSSGRLPVLDCHNGGKREASSDIQLIDNTSVKKRRKTMEGCESDAVEGVEASSDIQLIDNTSVKKRRETMEGCESDAVKSVKGHLLIGGIWKGISEDELLALESEVRILA